MGVFADEWYAIMLDGHKSGHMHSVMERRRTGKDDVIRTLTEMSMTAGRGGSVVVTVTVTQQTEETLTGRPLSFSNTMKLGMIPSVTKGVIKDGKVTVTTSQFGQPGTPTTYTLPENAMMSWAVYREQLKRGLKPGTRYTLPLYDPSIAPDRLTNATVEIGEKEQIDLFGRKVEAIRSKQIVSIKGLFGETPIETISWLDDNGDPVRLQMNLLNIPVEIIACSKPVALVKNDPADLMAGTLIKVEQPVDSTAGQITYRLKWQGTLPGTTTQPVLPETGMQESKKTAPGEMLVTVTRRSAQDSPPKSTAALPPDSQRYLVPAPTLNHRDPVVAGLAKEAAGDEKDPQALAKRLLEFVGEYVASKNLSVGFATASEVARSKEGDCTEHAVLLAALGRAVGIPTRLVIGVVYANNFADQRNVFVGHMWTQFWLGGQWVDLDPALHQTDVDPTHIALGITAAEESGIADMVSSYWLSLGKISLEIVGSK